MVNGEGPYSISVNDLKFYKVAALNGSLGYADRHWDCDQLGVVIDQLLTNCVRTSGLADQLNKLRVRALNIQTKVRSYRVAKTHYGVDTRIFEWMLDPYLQYTCG